MDNKNRKDCRILKVGILTLATTCFLKTGTADSVIDSVKTSAGQPAKLLCPGVLNYDVIWAFHDVHIARVRDIYSHGQVINGNVGRFELDSSEKNGTLKLLSSRTSDAGLYSCTENNGLGQTHYVLLNVVGNETVSPSLEVTTLSETTIMSGTGHYSLLNKEEAKCQVNDSAMHALIVVVIVLAAVVAFLIGVIVFHARRQKKQQKIVNDSTFSSRRGSPRIRASPTTLNLFLAGQGDQLHTNDTDNNADNNPMKIVLEPDGDKHSKTLGIILSKAMTGFFVKYKTKSEYSDALAVNAIRSVSQVWSSTTASQAERQALKKSLQRVSNNYSPRPLLLKSIVEPNQEVCAFTKLKDFIYVVRNQAIDKYDLKFNHVCTKTMTEFEVKLVIAGFTGNKHDGHMYLGDNKNRCVWKLDFNRRRLWNRTSVHASQWISLNSSTENVHSLCVIPGKNIGVLVGYDYYSGKLWKGKVLILHSDGSIAFHINLSPKIVQPCGIAAVDNRNLIVTYRDDHDGGIVEVDKRGMITSACRTIKEPRRCHYDEKGKCLFAIDTRSNRVLLYDLDFRLLRVVLEYEPVDKFDVDRRPTRILYSSNRSMLLIQMLSGRILAYRY